METVAIILGIALVLAVGLIVWLALGRARVAHTTERARVEAEQARRDAERAEQRRLDETSQARRHPADAAGAGNSRPPTRRARSR
jgi:hypothetical protein